MTNEERNTALYKKMYAEQERYRDWLLGQPPETILHHAYEYAAREDLLLSLEYNDLTDARAESLLSSEKPLEEAFHAYECRETGYMDEVFSCLESAAESLIREKQLADKAPLYHESAAYAREHGELDAYRASHKANVACREAIENAIRDNYNDNRLDTSCVKPIMDRFGVDRMEYVLANTVQHKEWDERFSSSNRAWAKTIPVVTDGNDFVGDRRTDFVVDRSHSGLTDLFVT
ncbi:MAG: DUF3849 domain-containing protein, partial [Faecousia sp.]